MTHSCFLSTVKCLPWMFKNYYVYWSKCTPPNTTWDSHSNSYLFKPNSTKPMGSGQFSGLKWVFSLYYLKYSFYFSMNCQFSEMCLRPWNMAEQGIRMLFQKQVLSMDFSPSKGLLTPRWSKQGKLEYLSTWKTSRNALDMLILSKLARNSSSATLNCCSRTPVVAVQIKESI